MHCSTPTPVFSISNQFHCNMYAICNRLILIHSNSINWLSNYFFLTNTIIHRLPSHGTLLPMVDHVDMYVKLSTRKSLTESALQASKPRSSRPNFDGLAMSPTWTKWESPGSCSTELVHGSRNQGRARKRYKDNLKTNIKWADLQPWQLEGAATNRTNWRVLIRKATLRMTVAIVLQRTWLTTQSSIHPCPDNRCSMPYLQHLCASAELQYCWWGQYCAPSIVSTVGFKS